MDTEQLSNKVVEEILRSGAQAHAVARDVLRGEWARLDRDTRFGLAVAGLARLANDEMHRRRQEEARQQEEARRQAHERYAAEERQRQQQTEERRREWTEREQRLLRYKSEHDWKGELDRAHAEACGCGVKTVYTKLDHLGGEGFLLLSPGEKEEHIRRAQERRAARRAYERYLDETHGRVHCRRRCRSYRDVERCLCYILDRPEGPEREEAIEDQRDLNDRLWEEEQERWGFIKEALKLSHDYGYRDAVRDLESIVLIASDGTMKPLLKFTRADVRGWRDKAGAQAQAWEEREQWFALAEQAMEEADVECLSELPQERIRALAAEARRIWKDAREGGDAAPVPTPAAAPARADGARHEARAKAKEHRHGQS
jgi:hypothetical protein